MTRQRTFTHGDASVTIHTKTAGDQLDIEMIVWHLSQTRKQGERSNHYRDITYAQMLTQTDEVVGTLPFVLPDLTADNDELRSGYDAVMSSDAAVLMRVWREALDIIDAPPTTESSATNDPKASPASDGNSTSGSVSSTVSPKVSREKSLK